MSITIEVPCPSCMEEDTMFDCYDTINGKECPFCGFKDICPTKESKFNALAMIVQKQNDLLEQIAFLLNVE